VTKLTEFDFVGIFRGRKGDKVGCFQLCRCFGGQKR
jgi:hypothetical protein